MDDSFTDLSISVTIDVLLIGRSQYGETDLF